MNEKVEPEPDWNGLPFLGHGPGEAGGGKVARAGAGDRAGEGDRDSLEREGRVPLIVTWSVSSVRLLGLKTGRGPAAEVQTVISREIAGGGAEGQDLESIAESGLEAVDERDIDRAAQRRGAETASWLYWLPAVVPPMWMLTSPPRSGCSCR